MRRSQIRVPVGEHQTKYKIRLEDDETAPGSEEARARQFTFLTELSSQPHLLTCGSVPFERFSMFHTGVRWVVELEALAEEAI